ncbi:MAG: hypothetical protein U5L04_05795 [Trueperaceae bacterium]|nr:hypothetical protein [Trueperaceae bacterium]
MQEILSETDHLFWERALAVFRLTGEILHDATFHINRSVHADNKTSRVMDRTCYAVYHTKTLPLPLQYQQSLFLYDIVGKTIRAAMPTFFVYGPFAPHCRHSSSALPKHLGHASSGGKFIEDFTVAATDGALAKEPAFA